MPPGASAREDAPCPLSTPPAGGRPRSLLCGSLAPDPPLSPAACESHGGICVHSAPRMGPGSEEHPLSSPRTLTEIQTWFPKVSQEMRRCLCPDSSCERGSFLLTAGGSLMPPTPPRSLKETPLPPGCGPNPQLLLKLCTRMEDPLSLVARVCSHTCTRVFCCVDTFLTTRTLTTFTPLCI